MYRKANQNRRCQPGTRMNESVRDTRKESIACPHCEHALTEAEIRSILGRFARAKRLSSSGASRFAKMTAEERSAEARKAIQARWATSKRALANGHPLPIQQKVQGDGAVENSVE